MCSMFLLINCLLKLFNVYFKFFILYYYVNKGFLVKICGYFMFGVLRY